MTYETLLTWVSDRYRALFSQASPRFDQIFLGVARPTLEIIEQSDLPYHTLDHTLQVLETGHLILEGKQFYEGSVSPQKWLHLMVSLLCHDVGYVKGIFERDRGDRHEYFDGKKRWIKIPSTATGAALSECHVDRSKAYVSSHLKSFNLDIFAIQQCIEMTRFPVPHGTAYEETLSDGGLCRAADLLGQLSDRQYLQKLPALFAEFEETGMNQALGYCTANDLKANFPRFYWYVVYPYVKPSVRYLTATEEGRKRIARLYTNLCVAELEPSASDTAAASRRPLTETAHLLPWQEAGFTFT